MDGLHYSFRLLAHHQETMYAHCCEIPQDNKHVVPALAACWGFVDALHRVRELTQAVPGLGKRSREMKAFLEATRLAEQYRHYIQHLRGELSKGEPNPHPVWGSLSWVDPVDETKSHTVVIGASLPGMGYAGAVYDSLERRWVSRVSLSIAGTSFNFDPLYREVEEYEPLVTGWIRQQEGEPLSVTESLQIVTSRVCSHLNDRAEG